MSEKNSLVENNKVYIIYFLLSLFILYQARFFFSKQDLALDGKNVITYVLG